MGEDFVAAVSTALERVRATPASFPLCPRTEGATVPIRKAQTARFPFVIAFEHPCRVTVST